MTKNPDDRWLWPAFWFVIAILVMILSGCASDAARNGPDGPAWWVQVRDAALAIIVSAPPL